MSDAPRDISHYRLDGVLGRGSMGAVYRGVDKRDGSLVAVKLLHRHLAEAPGFRERFEQEAHVAALLRSPYTVQVVEYGTDGKECFIAMEYVHGETLKQTLSAGALSPHRAARIALQVARALEEAETRGIVHRDIKPENVLITRDDAVKVADFGLARHASAAALTHSGLVAGTLAYAAPEQLAGDADHRSDIYGLGATLYCLVAGTPPFTGSLGETVQQIRTASPSLDALATTPDELKAVILRCLEKDPADRYQSAADLASALSLAAASLSASDDRTLTLAMPAATDGIALDLTPIRTRNPFTARRYSLKVANGRSQPVTVRLHAEDDDGRCVVRLPAEVVVPPRATVTSAVRVGPRRRRWRGRTQARIFTIFGSGDGLAPVAISGRFDDVPNGWHAAGAGALTLAGAAAIAGGVVLATTFNDWLPGGEANKAGLAVPLVAEGYTPTLEPRDCPAESAASGTDLRCHDLVVPEDRSQPDGRQIRVPVLMIPSTAPNPGVPTIVLGVHFNGPSLQQSDVRDYGDMVILGERGGVYAQPSLTCPEIKDAQLKGLALPVSSEETQNYLQAAETCGQRLASEGVDLNMYGLKDSVGDVRDLAIAMGWQNVNMEAHWEYSRLPNLLAARYPGLVRSVVLGDPYPPDLPVEADIASYASAFQAFFAACRANTECNRAVPNIEQKVTDVYNRLQQHPSMVTTADPRGGPDVQILIDGDAVVDAMLVALQGGGGGLVAGLLADSVDDTTRNAATAAFRVEVYFPDPAVPPLAYGEIISQYCQDEDQAESSSATQAQAALHPLFRGIESGSMMGVCAHWPTTTRSGVLGALGPANPVPALIVAGGLDPYATPAYAQRAASAFKDAKLAVFPSLSAFVLLNGPDCIRDLRLAFLRDPHANLDIDGCVQSAPPFTYPS